MRGLGIDFTDRVEPFAAPVNYGAFRAFSPTGQVPVLIDDDRTIWDSLGITLYLADRHEGVWPHDPQARAFAQCGVCEMHGGFSALRSQCTMNVGVRVKPAPLSPALQHDVARIIELFSGGLDRFGGPYLAGEKFSALDAFYAPVAYRVRTYGLNISKGQKWVDHILAHPAMLKWESAALAESWREQSHEEELLAGGVILEDFRSG